MPGGRAGGSRDAFSKRLDVADGLKMRLKIEDIGRGSGRGKGIGSRLAGGLADDGKRLDALDVSSEPGRGFS